jgi:hypothetical protein
LIGDVTSDPKATTVYLCYGLTIASDLPLPELLDGLPQSAAGDADVRIRLAPVPSDSLPGAEQLGPYLWAGGDRLLLRVPGVASYLVSGGDSIIVESEDGIDEDSVRVFLLGSALGALLFQRGLLVLHGNAVRVGDGCLVCVGPSGSGKSTLAAAFMRRGYDILADDVVPVDASRRVLPGFPRLKLWEDVAERLDIETAGLRRIRPNLQKYNFPVHDRYAGEPLPARWVYVLGTHREDETLLEPVAGMARFRPLRNNTYRVRYMEGMALKAQHLRLCGALATQVRLARVTRPERGFDLDGLVDLILADIAANP